jgi:hypothetical protein
VDGVVGFVLAVGAVPVCVGVVGVVRPAGWGIGAGVGVAVCVDGFVGFVLVVGVVPVGVDVVVGVVWLVG